MCWNDINKVGNEHLTADRLYIPKLPQRGIHIKISAMNSSPEEFGIHTGVERLQGNPSDRKQAPSHRPSDLTIAGPNRLSGMRIWHVSIRTYYSRPKSTLRNEAPACGNPGLL